MGSQSFSSERKKEERERGKEKREGRKGGRAGGGKEGREIRREGERKPPEQKTKAGSDSVHRRRNVSIKQESAAYQMINSDPDPGAHLCLDI